MMLAMKKIKPSERKSYVDIPKLLASIFLLNGDYYRALSCLRDVVFLEPTDSRGAPTFARSALLRLSLFLEEWDLFKKFYDEEKQRGVEQFGAAYVQIIECFHLIYLLHTEEDNNKVNFHYFSANRKYFRMM